MKRFLPVFATVFLLSGCGEDCVDVPDPAQTGEVSFQSGSVDLDMTVEDTSEQIAVTWYVPETPGPAPLVMFTHGFSSEPAVYLSYAERLASWGFVVVMPKLPASFLHPIPHRIQAEFLRGVLDWATGPGNAADGPLNGRVDPERVGLAGHSMGGKLSFLLAASDSRIDAVFGVDPVDAGPPADDYDPVDWPSVAPEMMGSITVPFVALGEIADGDQSDQLACAPANNRFEQYFDSAASPAVEIEIIGADHVSFLDVCNEYCQIFCRAGTDDPAVTLALTHKYMTAFFREQLMGESCLRDWLAGAAMQADIDAGLVRSKSKNGY